MQRVFIVKTIYENGESASQTVRKLRTSFGRNKVQCDSFVRRLTTKLATIASVLTMKSPGLKCSCQTEEQLVLVQLSVTVSQGKSIRRYLQQLDILPLRCLEFYIKISLSTRTKFNLSES